MRDLENEGSRPCKKAAPQIVSTTINAATIADDVTADPFAAAVWRSGTYRLLSVAEAELCAHCVTRRRHPDSELCVAELEAGAGDTWTGGAA